MKNILKKTFLIFIVLFLTSCTSEDTPQEKAKNKETSTEVSTDYIEIIEPRYYLALGDSISAGFGVAQEERYADILYEMLKSEGYVNDYINLAVNGYDTAMLLKLLNNMDEHNLNIIKDAEIITLSIGGNNILIPFINYMPDTSDIADILTEAIDFGNESFDTISETLNFAIEAYDVMNDFGIRDILNLIGILRRVSAVFDDITDLYARVSELELAKIISIFLGSFSPELESELEKGVQTFADDFTQILEWLETNAPNATIIINTVYNPIPDRILGVSLEISEKANILIQEINNIILEKSDVHIISDIYTSFAGQLNIMNMNLDLSALNLSFDFFHPNISGHSLIAQLNYDSFSANQN